MKKILFSKKAIHLSLLSGLICSVFLSMASFNTACDDLRTNVLRLHIIANSDSAADQSLKLRIRDEILNYSGELFSGADGIEQATWLAANSTEKIEALAERVISEQGADYNAAVTVGDCYFETRKYESFTLPAGHYRSLIVKLGEGKGKNWWCVIFPEVCLPAATEKTLTTAVNDRAAEIAYDKKHYILRFKVVEIYEEIKNLIIR